MPLNADRLYWLKAILIALASPVAGLDKSTNGHFLLFAPGKFGRLCFPLQHTFPRCSALAG
jgi:hypothetical protein